ncbi:MAG: metallophosphoesterase [Pseudomonadota bacterium]|nr:metallophosphoesterase [Pseudomonadota bacterium]
MKMSPEALRSSDFPRKGAGVLAAVRRLAGSLFLCAALSSPALAAAQQIDEYQWQGVDRVVALGDLHGDYDSYLSALRAAAIVDTRGRWIAGQAHLVQTGDIPDRGPDTRKIIAHMRQLASQARRQGGRVHHLIGNHEAMNVYGDLRYVTPGEYQAFVTRNAESLRDRYFDKVLQNLAPEQAGNAAANPEEFKRQWQKKHPLGWVEHRLAWDPGWNPRGEYFQWVMQGKVAIRINDMIFLHGGLSGRYCQNSLESLTMKAREALRRNDPQSSSILNDDHGPLWYRGLSGVPPEAAPETVAAILRRHAARRIVVGHTPTGGAIWPRYNGQVIQIDTGLGAAYGGRVAYLEATGDGLFAGYPSARIRLPANDAGRVAYLEQVIALQPGNAALTARLAALRAASGAGDALPQSEETPAADALEPAFSAETMPICDISQ